MTEAKNKKGFLGKSFARAVAFQIVFEHDKNPASLGKLDDEFIEEKFEELLGGFSVEEDGDGFFAPGEFPKGVSKKNIREWSSFARRLIETTLSERETIDKRIAAASDHWSLERMMTADRNILRIAVAEISFGEAPVPVVINEAIELGKKFGSTDSASFINGVLGKVVCENQKED